MGKNGIGTCYKTGCNNPVEFRTLGMDGCSAHGGETKPVWSVYKPYDYDHNGKGWLTDNDTLIEWVPDVDHARWFSSEADAIDTLVELEIVSPSASERGMDGYSITVVRLK